MPNGMFDKKEDDPKKHGLGGSFFGKHETPVSPIAVTDLSSQITGVSRRLRILEERYSNLRKNTQLTDQNILKLNKDFQREITSSTSDLVELRRDFLDLKEKVRLIVKELVECAKTEEVKVLEKYINLWEPVNFVTKKDVERIVEDKISEITSSETKDLKE